MTAGRAVLAARYLRLLHAVELTPQQRHTTRRTDPGLAGTLDGQRCRHPHPMVFRSFRPAYSSMLGVFSSL